MTENITIYLHVGATKTGSTALQRFFEQRALILRQDHRLLYPNFYDENIDSLMKEGVNYAHGRYFESSNGSTDIEVFQKCVKYCKDNSLRGIIISHEGLLNNFHERIGLLSQMLSVQFKIICYVRRQDHHLESAWKQVGYRFCSANELLHHKKGWGGWRQTNWYKQLEPWAKTFGKENVVVRPYEKEQLQDDIYSDFLSIIDVQWVGKPTLIREVNPNSGLSRDVMEFLYLNRDFHSGPGDQRLYSMLVSLLSSEYKKMPFESYNILSPSERIELLQEYEESNQKVAREYLGRNDGRLFYEPWPNVNDPWIPYDGLTIERLTPIITSILYSLFQREKELEKKYSRLDQREKELEKKYLDLENQYQNLEIKFESRFKRFNPLYAVWSFWKDLSKKK